MLSDFNTSRIHASVSSADAQSGISKERETELRNMLTAAAKNNDFETFEKFFDGPEASGRNAFDIGFTNDRGQTLLHIAAESGSDDFVKGMVETLSGVADYLDMVDESGYTALMYVAGSDTDKPDVVKAMIDAGANINLYVECGQLVYGRSDEYFLKEESALTLAISMGNKEAAAVIVKGGANPSGALRSAANSLDKPSLELLVSLGANVGVALEDAVEHEQKRATMVLSYVLFDRDLPLEPLSPKRESSPEYVKLLLSQGGKDALDALSRAVGKDNVNDVRALLDHGGIDGAKLLAETVLTSPLVARALMAAEVTCSAGMAHAFERKDADAARALHFFGGSRTEALVYAAESGNMDAVNAAIEYGADVTEALVHAATNGKRNAAAMLAEIQATTTTAEKV